MTQSTRYCAHTTI